MRKRMKPSGSSVEERMLDVNQLQEYLGVGRTTAWKMITTRELPAFRVGGRCVRVRESDVQAYLEENFY